MASAYKSSRADSISDSLEIIKITDLLKTEALLQKSAVAATQRYCDKLERRTNSMKDRQTRKNAGLIALLRKPSLNSK